MQQVLQRDGLRAYKHLDEKSSNHGTLPRFLAPFYQVSVSSSNVRLYRFIRIKFFMCFHQRTPLDTCIITTETLTS